MPHGTATMYTSQRKIKCSAPPTSISVANDKIVVGEINGKIQVFDNTIQAGDVLQEFTDHKGAVTDLYVVCILYYL